jgi:hypothetical protein
MCRISRGRDSSDESLVPVKGYGLRGTWGTKVVFMVAVNEISGGEEGGEEVDSAMARLSGCFWFIYSHGEGGG